MIILVFPVLVEGVDFLTMSLPEGEEEGEHVEDEDEGS